MARAREAVAALAAPGATLRDHRPHLLLPGFIDAHIHLPQAQVVAYDPKAPVFGPPNSADRVLTFRNVHNWRMADNAEAMFKGFYAVLKPGGTLGVVEHRAKGDVADDDKSGYVGQAQVIARRLLG